MNPDVAAALDIVLLWSASRLTPELGKALNVVCAELARLSAIEEATGEVASMYGLDFEEPYAFDALSALTAAPSPDPRDGEVRWGKPA